MEAEYLVGARGNRQQSGSSGIPWPIESAMFPTESTAFLTQSVDQPWRASASPSPEFLRAHKLDQLPTTIATVLATPTGYPDIILEISTYSDTISSTARRARPYFALHIFSTLLVVYFTL
jgi:hypothetical protein